MKRTETAPQKDSTVSADAAIDEATLDAAIVTAAPDQDGDGPVTVTVQHTRVPSDEPIPIVPTVHGDGYVPPVGTPVLVAKTMKDDLVAIAMPTPKTNTSDLKAGERVLSHPASKSAVRFNEDGSLDIYGDGDIRINNGTEGIVTDVSTTTDGDGHVTDITVKRDNSILL
ncbi:hypothetical protein GOC83_09885 [Haloarcula rubripromontorii]|uniref:Phage protein Gp138 N-terminal domain-containing protein n=1 Tax=Haloarcula rubripromontorii TaxID=1705562 RepID=A0A847U1U1_9EURY|nr:hypothetical protein [Haloarcula rubripromontorii]NLV06437.1 hypothetical protein [Haloarcula rubripromontorii]